MTLSALIQDGNMSFNALKQKPRIKTLRGTSFNGVMILIGTAMKKQETQRNGACTMWNEKRRQASADSGGFSSWFSEGKSEGFIFSVSSWILSRI